MTIWYLARAAGMIALLAFTMSVALGALGADSALPRDGRSSSVAARERALDRRILRQLAHRSAALVGLGALGLHVLLILVDSFSGVSLTGAIIPFTASYAAFAVGLGTIAVYVFVLVALSGLQRARAASSLGTTRAWRWVHGLAYGGWVLAMGHGILAGTDTGTLWSTAIYAACAIAVAAAVWTRLTRADRRSRDALVHARAAVRELTTTGASR